MPSSRSPDHSISDISPRRPTSACGIHGTAVARRRKLVHSSSSGPAAIARRPRSSTARASSSGWNVARMPSCEIRDTAERHAAQRDAIATAAGRYDDVDRIARPDS
jgi:hypothetical protein